MHISRDKARTTRKIHKACKLLQIQLRRDRTVGRFPVYVASSIRLRGQKNRQGQVQAANKPLLRARHNAHTPSKRPRPCHAEPRIDGKTRRFGKPPRNGKRV